MRTTILLSAILAAGCIESSRTASGDPEGAGGAGDLEADALGGASGAGDSSQGRDAATPEADDATPAERKPDAGVGVPDAGEVISPQEICPALCDRVDECLPAACPVLDATPSAAGFCDFCQGLGPDEAQKLVAATCEEIVAAAFEARPDAARFCSGEGPPPEDERCAAACAFLTDCGGEIGNCERFCRQAPREIVDCVLAAQACQELQGCFGMGQEPGPEQVCGNVCARTGNCLQDACAPGTVGPAWFEACFDTCAGDPPGPDEMQRFFQSTCGDLVAQARAGDPALDTRCDASPEEACATLCDSRIVPCGADFAPDACVAACAGFSDANLRCVQNSPECEQVLACFGDPEGEARCERACERIEGCLLEACPPRAIPPDLSFRCTAGCLPDPPAEGEVQQVLAATCAEVRQFVYRNNRELAPVCEGGRDFRPTADECAAFCDNGLQACLGVGGRGFCLAGCASLTRDQYVCALEAQGDCEAINGCLSAE